MSRRRAPARASPGDAGAITAEFAVAMPAGILVLALCLGGAQAAATLVRLQDAAADAARALGRGESAGVAGAIARRQVPGAALSVSTDGDVRCARLVAPAGGALGRLGLTVAASSCAMGGGR